MTNHVMERLNKFRGIVATDSRTHSNALIYWSDRFENKSVGNKIAGLVANTELTNVVIEERINNIVNLFRAYGHNENEAKDFIIKNPIILEKSVDFINDNLSVIYAIVANSPNKDLISFIKSEVNNGSVLLVNPNNLKGIYFLVFDMFASRSLNQQQAYEYLYNNNNLLYMSPDSIITKLSIYNLVKLDDQVFFSKPSMLDHKILYSEIYNAIAICSDEKNVSLENVTKKLSENNNKSLAEIQSSIVYKLDNESLEQLKNDYLAGLRYDAEKMQVKYSRGLCK